MTVTKCNFCGENVKKNTITYIYGLGYVCSLCVYKMKCLEMF